MEIFAMFFPVVLCSSIFLGTERYVLVLGSSLKYLWYLVVIFHQIITFLFSFTRMPIFTNLWLFFHKRHLAEFWCCCFYEKLIHMVTTCCQLHEKTMEGDYITLFPNLDEQIEVAPSAIHKNKGSLLASMVLWRTFIP